MRQHETQWWVQMLKMCEMGGKTQITNLFVCRGAAGTASSLQEKVQWASGPGPGDVT